ncbi:hypothetical protein [Deinococcus planocerae]|uniref:hypothetical protein n=1 Tax=Deinococcus planocerae TaxID=1737569 RepID=UPI0011AF5C10|nr:hypothetical protein [Deinococcus planocerae]
MRRPILAWALTPDEKRDPARVWARSDVAFFSAGACHVLAFAFLAASPGAGFTARVLVPCGGRRGTHVYVTDGQMAFDAQGFVSERALLRQHVRAYRALDPGWRADLHEGGADLAACCLRFGLQRPEAFLHDPFPRARAYLAHPPLPLAPAPTPRPAGLLQSRP